MTAILALIRKDLILFVNDRRALILTVLMPIVLGAFFGYIFGGSGAKEVGKVDIAVVMLDDSNVAKKIATALKNETTFNVVELGVDEARLKVLKGKLSAAVVIPAGFGTASVKGLFGAGPKPEISLFYDPSQTAVLQMTKGLLTQHVMEIVTSEMTNGPAGQEFVSESLDKLEAVASKHPEQKPLREMLASLKAFQTDNLATANKAPSASTPAASAKGFTLPFTTKEEAMTSGPAKYNGYAHSFAGMSVQFILFMGIDAGISILLARRMGLWNRLLAAPISLSNLLAARALSCALIAFGLLCVIFSVAALVFGVRITGNLFGFLGVGVCFAIMTASFGLLIAAFGKTPEAARSMATFATLIMVMLGGAWVPSFIFPQWMQTATLFVPTRWAVDGFDAMTWRGQGMDVAAECMAVQIGFALLFGSLALWKFGAEAKRA
ncbi:MAG: ABC transporter permease [Rhodocyclaceae bacterium]|nr:ABC transporter permease [Rhodocyclaceae bacterium]